MVAKRKEKGVTPLKTIEKNRIIHRAFSLHDPSLVHDQESELKIAMRIENIARTRTTYSTCDLGNNHRGHQTCQCSLPSEKESPWVLPQ